MSRSYLIGVLLLLCSGAVCQTPITNVATNYQSVNAGRTYTLSSTTYNYGNLSGTSNNHQTLMGFTLPSGEYLYSLYIDGAVKMRRVDNSTSTGNKTLIWMESTQSAGVYNLAAPYTDSMESFFNGRTFNKGTDNLFANQGDAAGNNNNIERVDWIVPTGLATNKPAESGFGIFERGADDAHDPFCIAPILALDASGNPSQYGQIVRVSTANFGNISSSTLDYSILRKEEATPLLYHITTSNQNRGGVFMSFLDLGVDAGEVVYGYSLFGHDLPVSATSANLVDYANTSFFPNNTSANTSEGGIDLIAITGFFKTAGADLVLPVKYSNWSVSLSNNKPVLKWQIADPGKCSKTEVQRSSNGKTWKTVTDLSPNVTQFVDENAGSGTTYYRLRFYEGSNSFSNTPVKKINIKKSAIAGLAVQHRHNKLMVHFRAERAGEAYLQVYTHSGQLILNSKKRVLAGTNQLELEMPAYNKAVIVTLTLDGNTVSKQAIF